MTTYMLDKETRQLIPKSEWWEKYGEEPQGRGPMIINRKFENYVSPTSGETITSFRQREEDMKASGCVDYEPTLKDEIDRNVIKQEQQLDAMVDETVEHTIAAMPARKREQLESELMSGADIEVTRE